MSSETIEATNPHKMSEVLLECRDGVPSRDRALAVAVARCAATLGRSHALDVLLHGDVPCVSSPFRD